MARQRKVYFGDASRSRQDREQSSAQKRREIQRVLDKRVELRRRQEIDKAQRAAQDAALQAASKSESVSAIVQEERLRLLDGVPDLDQALLVSISGQTISADKVSAIFNQEWSRVSEGVNVGQLNDIFDVIRLLYDGLIELRNHVEGLSDIDVEPLVAKMRDFFRPINPFGIKEFVLPEMIGRAIELETKKNSLESRVRTSYHEMCATVDNYTGGLGERQFEAGRPIQEYKQKHGICCLGHFGKLPLLSKIAGVFRYLAFHLALHFDMGPLVELVRPFKKAFKEFLDERDRRLASLKQEYLTAVEQHRVVAGEFARFRDCYELCKVYADFANSWNKFSRLSKSRADERSSHLTGCFVKTNTLGGKGEEGKKSLSLRVSQLARAVDKLRDSIERELHTHRRVLDVAYSFSLTKNSSTTEGNIDFVACVVGIEEEIERLKARSSRKKEEALEHRLATVQQRVGKYDGVLDVLRQVRAASDSSSLVPHIDTVLRFVDLQREFADDPMRRIYELCEFAEACGLQVERPRTPEQGVELVERLNLKLGIPTGSSLFEWLIRRAISSQRDRVIVRWYQSLFEAKGLFPEVNGLVLPDVAQEIRWGGGSERQSFEEFYYRALDAARGISRVEIGQRLLVDAGLSVSLKDHTLKHVQGFGLEATGHLLRRGLQVISLTEESAFLAKARQDPSSPLYETKLAAAYSRRTMGARALSQIMDFENDGVKRDVLFYVYSTLLAIQRGQPFIQEHLLKNEGYRVPELSFLLPLGEGRVLCALFSLRLDLKWFTTFVTNWELAGKSRFFAPIPANIFDLDL